MTTLKWEHFSHEADVGIRGFGSTMEEAFAMAIIALTAIVANPDTVEPKIKIQITCHDEDVELLFYDWINSVIYEMDTKNMLFSIAKVHIDNSYLEGEIWGEIIVPEKHDPAVAVKGATMTELKVSTTGKQWITQCVVDV
ncbi:MAG: archease [Bdellovibrio sp.]|nr:archease [Bdellovibrio sp.]